MPSNFVGENMPMSPNNSGEGDIHQYFRIYMVRPWLCGLPLIFVNSVFSSEYPQYIVHDSICWLLHLLFFVTFFLFCSPSHHEKKLLQLYFAHPSHLFFSYPFISFNTKNFPIHCSFPSLYSSPVSLFYPQFLIFHPLFLFPHYLIPSISTLNHF